MTIPDYQSLMSPILMIAKDGAEHSVGEITQKLADSYKLSEEERKELVKQDKLGLDTVYIQAKRWEGVVGSPELQKFVGSLEGHHATKGVFITTSKFSDEGRKYIEKVNKKVVLIDGEQLAELMIEHGIGATEDTTYTVKKLDLDYFTEE